MLKEITFEQLLELPIQELTDFKTALNLAILEKEQRDKLETREKIEEIAKQAGFSLEELLAVKPTKKQKSASVLYRNSDNPSQTWSGKGRKPNWLVSALEAGKSLDDFKA